MLTAIVKLQIGPGDEVSDRTRDQDFTRQSSRYDARPDVNGDTDERAAALLALTRMDPRANLETHSPNVSSDSDCAVHSTGGTVKSDEKAVPGRVHLPSPEASDLFSNDRVVIR